MDQGDLMFFRKLFGFLALLIGFVGVLLSIAIMVGVWPVTRQLSTQALAIADDVQPALVTFDARLGQADAHIAAIRGHINEVRTVARAVATKASATGEAERERLEATAGRVADALGRAEEAVENVRAGLAAAQSLAKLSSSLNVSSNEDGDRLTEQIEAIASILKEVSIPLHALRQHVAKVKSGKDIEEGASAIVTLTTEIDGRIAPLEERVEGAHRQIRDFNNGITKLRKEIVFWTDLAPILVTVFFLWMGLGQLSLLIHGWKLLRTEA